MLDTIESDDEEYIENTIIDSDTVFVAEDESVISTNIIGKDEIGDQSSLVSVPQASIHIQVNNLGQNEQNSVPATQRDSNQLPSPANQRISNPSPSPANQRTTNQSHSTTTQGTSNQSPAAATQRTTNQSPAAVVTRRIADQSSKSTPSPTVTLPKSTNRWEQSSMIKDKMEEKTVNASSEENNTNQKKGSVLQDEHKANRKNNTTKKWEWEDKEKSITKKECTLEEEVLADLDHGSTL